MGCTDSKPQTKSNDPYQSSNGSTRDPKNPEFFNDDGSKRIPPAAAQFLKLALEDRDPLASYVLEQWTVYVYHNDVLLPQLRSSRDEDAAGGDRNSVTSAAPRLPRREGDAASRRSVSPSTSASSASNRMHWVNTEFDEPIAYADADRCGKLSVQYIRMDLVHRGWHGAVAYDVEGTTDVGVLKVIVDLQSGGRSEIVAHFHACID